MGNLRACFAVAMLALAACGSDQAQPDASIKLIDAAIDAKVWQDAPPGPTYDLSCLDEAAPTTAADPIKISGTTSTLTMSGAMAVPNVDVDVFEVNNATALATVTSDANGAFATGDIATAGTPINGYVRAMEPDYRSTYMYPGTVVATDLSAVPVIVVSNDTFGILTSITQTTQMDDVNGAIVVLVTDCSATPTPIKGATVAIEQNGSSVGSVLDLGGLIAQAAGTFFVFNVPDGETQVKVTYDGKAFPARTVTAYKKPSGQNAEATITLVQVRPSN